MSYTKITLLLLTHNETSHLKSNFGWIDKCQNINEIIVVDDNSSENIKDIVSAWASPKRKVIFKSRSLKSDFSAQRRFGLKHSKNDWILWLDPDESPSAEAIDFISKFTPRENIVAYTFKRLDTFLGYPLNHGETGSLTFTRLFNRQFGNFAGSVHESWRHSGNSAPSNTTILHQPHQNLTSLLQKINFYTDIRASELHQLGATTSLFQIIFYPLLKFCHNYFWRLGFLDGVPGIIIALSMSFHSFLVRAKLWQLSHPSPSDF